MRFLFLLALTTIFLASCGSETETPTGLPGDPSNLTIDIEVAEDQSGLVTIQATATDAILYEFDFGTVDNDSGVSEDGRIQFVYQNSGVFTIEIKAFGNSGRFIRQERQVNIESGDPATAGEGYTTPISYEGMNLLWNDEFNGTSVDQSIWSFDNGNGCPNICGWGNNELEYYRPENSTVSNGALTIEAREELFQNNEYTSTKLISQGKKVFTYGRVDVRAQLPRGKGLWPAIWMLGQNITSVGWPASGEIDIMEMVGGNGGENTTFGTAHWSVNNNQASNGDSRTVSKGLDQEFHVFSIIWDENRIQWLLNDIPYHNLDITGSDKDAFHKPFYMILNVAVGGNWPGSPTSATEFPTQMKVDYVRVFQDQ